MKVIFEVSVGPDRIPLSKTLDLPCVPVVGTEVETDGCESKVTVESVALNLEKKGLAWFRVCLSPVTLMPGNPVDKYVEDAIRDRGWERG